jgi:two-component system cell cycle response regulator
VPDDWDEDTTATNLAELTDASLQVDSKRRACITVLSGSSTGQVYKLIRGTNVLGRAHDAQLRILDDGVSRHHAVIRLDGEIVQVEDLGSRNGSYLNGQRITSAMSLKEGDKVQIGRTTVLRFAFHDELDESFHENLLSSALRDPLTKLFNKRYLMDRLDSELKFSKRHETAVSVLMLDLDHFKKINDGHGHLAGDAVLSQLANVLVRAVRNEDVVARFGGEEFVIILRAISIELAVALGERLRRLVETTVFQYQSKILEVTVSVGAAGFPSTRADTVEQLLEAGDQALYRAKNAGRNRVSR